jgi:hypothetical protein
MAALDAEAYLETLPEAHPREETTAAAPRP